MAIAQLSFGVPTQIKNVVEPSANTDVATKQYVDARVSVPGGANTTVQFNANGVLGGDANFTYNTITDTLLVNNIESQPGLPLTLNTGDVTTGGGQGIVISAGSTTDANSAGGSVQIEAGTGDINGQVLIGTLNTGAVVLGGANVNLNFNNSNVNAGNVANVHIFGGTTGQVLTTDGAGNLSWTTVGGGGGSLIFTQHEWQPGNGPADQTNYWDGSATQVNFKPVAVGYVAAGNVNTLNLLTINGVSISNANITVTPTGFTIPANNIPANVQTATGSLQMIMRVSVGGANPELGSATLTPSLLSPVSFTTSGTLTATGVNPTAVPFWQSTGNGSVTASGLSVSGGTLANVTYSLVQNANVIATSPVQGSFATYTFTNVPVGTGYSLTANINGSGVRGANPNVNTTTSSGNTNVTSQFYTPLFYQTTSNSTVPTFTTSTTYVPQQFVSGQSVVMPNTSNGNYYWLATPGNTAHTFSTVVLGQPVTVNPDATGTTTIDTQAYNVYGFTNSQANTVLTIN